MSEDDNTNSADDSAYASNTITNDDLNVSVPTSNSLCHNISAISVSSDLTRSPQSIAPPVVTFTSVQIRASNATSALMEGSVVNSIIDVNMRPNESCFDPVVSSTNTVEDERLRSPESDASTTTASLRIVTPPSIEYDQQPTDLTMNNNASSSSSSPFMHVVSMTAEKHVEANMKSSSTSTTVGWNRSEQMTTEQLTTGLNGNRSDQIAPDTSGLQLLSNMAATAAATTAAAAAQITAVGWSRSEQSTTPDQNESERNRSEQMTSDENGRERHRSEPISAAVAETLGCSDFRIRNIKQEPIERSPPQSSSGIYDDLSTIESLRPTVKQYPTTATEPLGGLNLLCALAEQRFQEEVGGSGHRSDRKRSSSSEESEPKRVKKHKEKHASKKAKKRERKEKKRLGSGVTSIDDTAVVEKDFKETFDRVKAKYTKCDCRKTAGDGVADECCCRSVNWLTPEQMYSAMKSEYRDRLAEIAREFQEKKRKLDAMNSKELRLQRESTPSSSKSGGSSSKLSTLSPSILSTSSLECNQSSVIDFTSNGKVPSDSESCSSTSSKRKHISGPKQSILDADVQAKRQKSLVGYIFASKKRHNESNSFSTTDEASLNSDNSRMAPTTTTTTTATTATTIKQEVFEFDESSTPPEINLFGDSPHHFPRKPLTLAETMVKNQKLGKHTISKHHKKIKSGKERKHHRRSTETRERKQRISNRCTLTDQHLDALIDGKKIRVLTAMGGLFYAGCLNAVQPPDVYAVTLDGERGNRPHIMSREEILRDAVSVNHCPVAI